MRKNSVKNRRINDEVLRALMEIIRGDMKDPRISPLMSITACEVAPDLKSCKVWVSVYGGADELSRTLEGLESASGFIRSELARRINLRNTPELRFHGDDSIAYGVAMSSRIDEVTAKDREAQALRGEEEIEDTE